MPINKKQISNFIFLGIDMTLVAWMSVISWYTSINQDAMYVLHDAVRMIEGEVLYKDLFQFYPPFSIVLLIPYVLLFGKSFFSLAFTNITISVCLFWTAYIFAQKFTLNRLFTFLFPFIPISTFLFVWTVFNPHWIAAILSFWIIIYLVDIFRKEKPRTYLFMVSFLSSLSILNHTTKGLFICLATALIIGLLAEKDRIKQIFLYFLAVMIMTVLMFLPFIIMAGWKNFYYGVFWFPMNGYLEINAIIDRVSVVIFVLLAALAIFLIMKFKKSYLRIAFITTSIIGVSQVLASVYRFDFTHFLIASAPMWIIILFLVQKIPKKAIRYQLTILGVTVMVVLLLSYATIIFLTPTEKVDFKGGKIKMPTKIAQLYNRDVKIIDSYCTGERYVFFGNYIPSMYFFTDYKNPTRFSILHNNYSAPDMFDEAWRDIKEKDVRCLVFCESLFFTAEGQVPITSVLEDIAEKNAREKIELYYFGNLYIL